MSRDESRGGRLLSLVLRHRPDKIGIELDGAGWTDVKDLLEKIKYPMAQLDWIVEHDSKGRYEFNDDKTRIRATQGHSVKVDLGYAEAVPPPVLYHGTAEKYLKSILDNGIHKASRHHVHLSEDLEVAFNVGARHGTPIVLHVDAFKMHAMGRKFFRSTNGVWLTDEVPDEYLVYVKHEDGRIIRIIPSSEIRNTLSGRVSG